MLLVVATIGLEAVTIEGEPSLLDRRFDQPRVLAVFSRWCTLALLLATCCRLSATKAAEKATILKFSVVPAARGTQLVRGSVPLPPDAYADKEPLYVQSGDRTVRAAVRSLAWQPSADASGSVRAALVTFPWTFKGNGPVRFTLAAGDAPWAENLPGIPEHRQGAASWRVEIAPDRAAWLTPQWPAPQGKTQWTKDVIEENAYFQWIRWRQFDNDWARTVELRLDCLGQITAVAHLQRRDAEGNWSPRFGWQLAFSETLQVDSELGVLHEFDEGEPHRWRMRGHATVVAHPAASKKRSGYVAASKAATDDNTQYLYLRSEGEQQTPHQPYAWRRAEMVVSPEQLALPTPTLRSQHRLLVDWQSYDARYHNGEPVAEGQSQELTKLLAYHRDAICRAAAVGPDWGNVTSYRHAAPYGAVHGMNRLNHCMPIFHEAFRSGDERLLETAIAWCDNFHDLSIWWGPEKTGGTRYNSMRAQQEPRPGDDDSFMWRSNKAVHFCTKGYDSLLVAYEQTGDPRHHEAWQAQTAYAMEFVHADEGEARNIGDVTDFVRIYQYTDDPEYLDHGMRLFRELRTRLMPDGLFSQSGRPIVSDPPFIDDDQRGSEYPFAKPYIIGYALSGCPKLTGYYPDEPRLMEMVEAVGDFLAQSQDPLGGWRYPHPHSSYLIASQGMEHAGQLCQAGLAVGPKPTYLDAIERTLRQRIQCWLASGQILHGLQGWEISAGEVASRDALQERYRRPEDRNASLDYRLGDISLGSSSPEGIVYFPEVLRYYLAHRQLERLLSPPTPGGPLHEVLSRLEVPEP